MRVTIAGTGYVGLVTGACLAEVGNDVVCKVRSEISAELVKRGVKIEFAVVAHPEFLKEGAAVDDFMHSSPIPMTCGKRRASTS